MAAHESDNGSAGARPDLSVIIATRNRAGLLETTLTHLAAQELDGRAWEVVVVDNGSTDDTPRVLDDFADRLPLVRLEHAEAGKNRALNRALTEARGDLLVFTDDDVAAPSRWLATLSAATDRWPEDNIFGGPVVPRFPPGTPSWMTRPDFEHTRWAFSGYHPRETEGATWQTPLGPNMAIRRNAMPETPYNETIGPAGTKYVMGSEVELLLRMYRGGEQFIFVPDAPVEHLLTEQHVTVDNVMARAHRFGRSEARLFPGSATYPVFAVAPYRWGRLASAFVKWCRTRFRDEGVRRVAEMELVAARATVGEQFRMWRESRREAGHEPGGVRPRLLPRPGAIATLVRRRGPLGLARTLLARALSPLVRTCTVHVYDADLATAPETRAAVVDKGLDIVVCHGSGDLRKARTLICPMGIMTPEEIEGRLADGHSVAIGSEGGRAVGYAWACFDDHHVAGLERTMSIGPEDVCAYDGFVHALSRGQGVLPSLDRAQMAFARERGVRRQLTYAMSGNRASRRSMARMGKRPLLRVRAIELPLLRRRFHRASDPTLFGALFEPEGAGG